MSNLPQKRRGLILVRNVDLDVWEAYKRLAASQDPEAKLGPFLSQTLRERIERETSRR